MGGTAALGTACVVSGGTCTDAEHLAIATGAGELDDGCGFDEPSQAARHAAASISEPTSTVPFVLTQRLLLAG